MLLVFIIVIGACFVAAKKGGWNKLQRALFPLFVFYLCAVFSLTIVNRLPYDEIRYNLALFWSYQAATERSYYVLEILLNYFLLLPYGFFVSLYINQRYVILSGILLSVCIEIAQLFMKRGLFEFDDILGNALGIVLGMVIYNSIRKRVSDSNEDIS